MDSKAQEWCKQLKKQVGNDGKLEIMVRQFDLPGMVLYGVELRKNDEMVDGMIGFQTEAEADLMVKEMAVFFWQW